MLRLLLEKLGLTGVVLHINSLGCVDCRRPYREKLQKFLGDHTDRLCPDCQRRRHTNPLRAFDCKVDRCQVVLADAPMLIDSVCNECAEHFIRVKGYLEDLQTPFVINPRMVRGLDYYMRTTFEIITDRLGAQNAVGGGGRYNGLVRDLGGPDIPAIGFAIGMERLILLLQQDAKVSAIRPTPIFLAVLGERARHRGFLLAQQMRGLGLEVELDYEGRSLKSQMRRADKLGSRYVVILGEDEIDRNEAQLRDMQDKKQSVVPLSDAAAELMRLSRPRCEA
jgi:histidyl-tRNA synthetase